jgi:hypothetical protein
MQVTRAAIATLIFSLPSLAYFVAYTTHHVLVACDFMHRVFMYTFFNNATTSKLNAQTRGNASTFGNNTQGPGQDLARGTKWTKKVLGQKQAAEH